MRPYQIIHPDGGVEASFDYMGQVYDYMYQKLIVSRNVLLSRVVYSFGASTAVFVTNGWSMQEVAAQWFPLVKALNVTEK